MKEQYRVSAVNRKLLGIGAVVVVVVMIGAGAMALSPVRYFFAVHDGSLALWGGKMGWLDAKVSESLTPIYVGTENFKPLTERYFKSEEAALEGLREFIEERIEDQQETLFVLEKRLAEPYTRLLHYYKQAQLLGVEDVDEGSMELIREWLKLYNEKAKELAED